MAIIEKSAELISFYKIQFGLLLQSRVVGTGGARGAHAPSVFWGIKVHNSPRIYLIAWLLSIVRHLVLEACYSPVKDDS